MFVASMYISSVYCDVSRLTEGTCHVDISIYNF